MKIHSNEFKTQIKELGRQLDSIITYTLNEEIITLSTEDLNSVTPHYNGNILKSVMKQLDIDSKIDIPIETIINYKFGLKVNGEYEYLNFGNYIVKSSEKSEDNRSYKITCYDKMLYSMKDYVTLNVNYPINIRDYIHALCTKIGLEFSNKTDTFVNYNQKISKELYLDSDGNSLGYKFRDVLDELAQATASTICINNDDELEIRYITDTNDMIDEEYFKSENVSFAQKYGPVNSIVLSRSAGSDNIYLKNDESILNNGLCEIKIEDNQILNWNDRDLYLPDIFSKLNGLEYYVNDYSSKGICYYDLCDKYNVVIGENSYSCVMLNNEVLVSQGLEENCYTEIPITSDIDYSKSDKTDRRIKETYLIVNKQNQKIEAAVTNSEKALSQTTQFQIELGKIQGLISESVDTTKSAEGTGFVSLENINQSEPVMLQIHPTTEDISYLYPADNLYPSDDLFLLGRTVIFENTTTKEKVEYELPCDLLICDGTYDEFTLDLKNRKCTVSKKVGVNSSGENYVLSQSETREFDYPTIKLSDGNYKIYLLSFNTAHIFCRLMSKNVYTEQFATNISVESAIEQLRNSITLSIKETLSNYSTTTEMNSAITMKANEISNSVNLKITDLNNEVNEISGNLSLKIDKENLCSILSGRADDISFIGNRFSWTSTNSSLTKDGKLTVKAGDIAGFNMSSTSFSKNLSGIYNYTEFDLQFLRFVLLGYLNINKDTSIQNIMDTYTEYAGVGLEDLQRMREFILGTVQNTKNVAGKLAINSNNPKNCLIVQDNSNKTVVSIGLGGVNSNQITAQNVICADTTSNSTSLTKYVALNGIDGNITASGTIKASVITQTSLDKKKKNFEKYTGALEEIKKVDIYKYNLKSESNDTKKHLGFVIGKGYRYSQEITSDDNTEVDLYSMISLCLQAIKELERKL